MKKLNMQTDDITQDNIERIAELFPNALTETIGDGEVKRAIDFDVLREELSADIVDGTDERYQFTWPGKRQVIKLANAPINKTLRPVREESVDFDTTENLYIEGDNLEVLKLLRETYLGKIKSIYIDPPYNTGNDFVYKDDFTQSAEEHLEESGQVDEEGGRLVANPSTAGRYHTDWLNMMYPRLKLARDLLTDDGVIFISIDSNEVHNLRRISDAIFGENSFVGQITRATGTTTGQDANKIGASLDYILVYQKSPSFVLSGIALSDKDLLRFKHEDARGKYSLLQMRKTGNNDKREDRPNMYFPAISPEGIEVYPIGPSGYESRWRFGVETYQALADDDMIVWQESRTGLLTPYVKYYLEGRTKAVSNLWDDIDGNKKGSLELKSLFGKKLFDNPKPTQLIKRILHVANVHNVDTILDFFSGSATTAHAVMQLNAEDGGNRKFIMVQLPEETDEKSEAYKAGYKTIAEIGKERIRRAGTKIKEEAGLMGDELDIGFRVLKVDSSNMCDVFYQPEDTDQATLLDLADNIKEDRTPEDLLFQVMLDMGISLSASITKTQIEGKTVFAVSETDDAVFLLACFDTEISDEVVTEMAARKPLYAVLRDSGMADDSVAANFEQIFKTQSPQTEIKVL